MQKLFYALAALITVTSATHTISYNPASYIKTEAPLTLEYAKSAGVLGVLAGVAFHAVPHLCTTTGIGYSDAFSAVAIAALLGKACYENYNAEQEQKNCEAIAHTWNTKATDKAKEVTGVRVPFVIKAVGPDQFKMQNESHRAAATFGGFTTGFLYADALFRSIAWICA